MNQTARYKKVVFIADAIGQALNCVAIGQQLVKHQIEPILLADKSFEGMFKKYGMKEYLVDIYELPSNADASKIWTEYVRKRQKLFKLKTIDQIESYIAPYWKEIVDSAIKSYPIIKKALSELKADFIVIDDVILYPAVLEYGKPWIRMISCNELEIPDLSIPPALSGYSSFDQNNWKEFRSKYLQSIEPCHKKFNDFIKNLNIQPLPQGLFLDLSPYLNFLIYPSSIKYDRKKQLNDTCIYLNGCVRKEEKFDDPFKTSNKPLIYLCYGSMGASETELIKKQLKELSKLPINILAGVGKHIKEYSDLTENIYIKDFFPQPSVIEQADLVIHHGGNNTFNEVLFFGKHQIILPFAWDGYDNAMRVKDLNIGIYLHRYKSSVTELSNSIQKLLSKDIMADKIQKISKEMKKLPGTQHACSSILEYFKN